MTRKRILRWVLSGVIVVVVALAAVIGTVATAFVGLKPAEDGATLPGGAELVKDGFSNVFLLPAGPDKVVLIDCGMDPQAKAVVAALKGRGLAPEAVEAVFLTHGHPDHTGGCKAFPRARLMALGPEVGLIEGTATVKSPMTALAPAAPKPTGLKVARTLVDGETVALGPLSVRAFAAPGHTPGSAAYLARGVLFLGDAGSITSQGGLRNAAWVFSNDTARARASLKALAARLAGEGADLQMVAPAHSAPGPAGALMAFAAKAG